TTPPHTPPAPPHPTSPHTFSPVVGCLATGYIPGPVTFSWSGASGATSVTVPETHGVGFYTLQPTPWGRTSRSPPDLQKTPSRPHNTSHLPPPRPPGCVAGGEPTPPEVQVLHSSVCSTLGDDSVELHCVITGFSPPPVEVEWLVDGAPAHLVATMTRPQREHFNGTFTASSSLAISTQDWLAGERFTCTVQHEDLPEPLGKSIAKHAGKVTAPYIFTFPPHAEELSLAEVTLTCLVRGFQPEHVEVQWLRNHNSVPAAEFVTTPPLKEPNGDGTFFLYSKMTVPKASWQGGVSYACMVVHEGLPMRFTQRPLQKTPELDISTALCPDAGDQELDGLWATIAVFITLFLLSVCYSATVTFFKVKWLFSTVLQLKSAGGPYRNVLKEAA
uniref:Ig-like domain-containing protein n=1 Tax=Anas zonorhyncha TaxID=75864 RepID=A0A8B9V9G8_9AVES